MGEGDQCKGGGGGKERGGTWNGEGRAQCNVGWNRNNREGGKEVGKREGSPGKGGEEGSPWHRSNQPQDAKEQIQTAFFITVGDQ